MHAQASMDDWTLLNDSKLSTHKTQTDNIIHMENTFGQPTIVEQKYKYNINIIFKKL